MRLLHLFIPLLLLAGFQSPEETDDVTIIIETKESSSLLADQIESRLPRLEIVAEYDTIFNGLAVKGTAQELEKLARMDMVINQYPVVNYKSLKQVDTFSTQVIRDQYNLPYTGKGVKVGVIDTGVDYSHPDLQNNYRGGFDTVDFDNDPMETRGEGATMHGSHVAGVIAADGKMKGIAPDAELYAYRALGPGGVGSSVQVIAALEEAVKERMDVINLSLGNDVNGPDWPTSHAVNRAVELGVTVVVAAGNSGPDTWTVGSPATSSKAITVGASALPSKAPVFGIPGEHRHIPVQVLQGSDPWELSRKYPLLDGGRGEEELTDASGKIVLFERGEISFQEKAFKAYQAGAAAVIIYNNEPGLFQGSLANQSIPIPVAAVSKKDGEWLLQQGVRQNQWLETTETSLDHRMAPFSSRGPVTTTWGLKPDVVAPGVNILSTVPGGYAALQGTSMAAPHVAGLAALLKEAHPDWSPQQIKSAMMSSADILEKDKLPYAPTEQGTGFIDVEESLNPTLLIEPGSLAFGRVDQSFLNKKEEVKLTNPTNESQTVYINAPAYEHGSRWDLPSVVHLEPNETKTLEIGLHLTKSFLNSGIKQGFITLTSHDRDFHIPYLYMVGTSDYEKVSGFELSSTWADARRSIYRFHLTEPVDKITVDLFRAGTMLPQGRLFELEDPQPGMVEGEFKMNMSDLEGAYIAVLTLEYEKQKESYPFPVKFTSQ
ncbi:S8 family serine peptidase [Halobacillus sp. K22]|uniref:S8 family serine peptidase n=1 Tax=Halobacillus sp. K22 TaxID=3457431 RepID=UPI003FCEBA6E